MKNKLQKHFPMIRTKGEALEAIKNNKKLWGIFCSTARIRYTIKYLKDGLIIFTQKERKGTMQTKDSEEVVARFGAKLI